MVGQEAACLPHRFRYVAAGAVVRSSRLDLDNRHRSARCATAWYSGGLSMPRMFLALVILCGIASLPADTAAQRVNLNELFDDPSPPPQQAPAGDAATPPPATPPAASGCGAALRAGGRPRRAGDTDRVRRVPAGPVRHGLGLRAVQARDQHPHHRRRGKGARARSRGLCAAQQDQGRGFPRAARREPPTLWRKPAQRIRPDTRRHSL